jgi:hypothetical protein
LSLAYSARHRYSEKRGKKAYCKVGLGSGSSEEHRSPALKVKNFRGV